MVLSLLVCDVMTALIVDMEQAKAEFEALQAKLNHNIEYDLNYFRPEIQQYLEQEITRRYYYEKGEIITSLKYDTEVEEAVEILSSKQEYNKILKIEAKESKKSNKK